MEAVAAGGTGVGVKVCRVAAWGPSVALLPGTAPLTVDW